MKDTNTTQHPHLINLENETADWHLIDPLLHVRRLNRLLDRPDIQENYHEASLGFDCFCRWEALQGSDYTRFPVWKARPSCGRSLLRPIDTERGDWRFWRGPGRPPKYLDYVGSQMCHWLAWANLPLARLLFPDQHWITLSGQYHTSVVCADERLIFDLNYSPNALDVSAADAIEMIVKDPEWQTFDDEQGNEYQLSETTRYAMVLCSQLDNVAEDQREQVLAGMRQCLEEECYDFGDDTPEELLQLVAA